MNILITGGAGFIGSNFIRYMNSKYPEYRLVNLDLLTYAGNLQNLRDIDSHPLYTFVHGDIGNRPLVDDIIQKHNINTIINFAAESHVDRSITNAGIFVQTNLVGTQILLEAALCAKIETFIQVSTDEVYGSLGPNGFFTEDSPLEPNSPYSCSKAGADLIVRAYHETYGLNVNITRCSNNYGPNHFPEKLIPLIITNALENQPIPVYGDGLYIRNWLYVTDHAAAIDRVLHGGRPGEVYNIGGHNERTNMEIVRMILAQLGKSEDLIRYVTDRPGHDRRYAIDPTKTRNELGWEPLVTLDQGLASTVEWYLRNQDWWKGVKSGKYQDYYQKEYAGRLLGA